LVVLQPPNLGVADRREAIRDHPRLVTERVIKPHVVTVCEQVEAVQSQRDLGDHDRLAVTPNLDDNHDAPSQRGYENEFSLGDCGAVRTRRRITQGGCTLNPGRHVKEMQDAQGRVNRGHIA
jgi:hypothetical protein